MTPRRLHPRKTGRSLLQLPAQAPRSRPRSLGSLLTPSGFHTFPQPRLLRALAVPSVAEAMEMCKNLHRLGSPSEGNPARPRPHRQCPRLFPSSQHRRFLFSAYAPLPVPEALLPITPLAPGCPYDLPWLRNARTEPDAAGKAQKTFASQNSSPYGFLVPPCPWSEPVRLPDHKEGHKGPHQVPRRSS